MFKNNKIPTVLSILVLVVILIPIFLLSSKKDQEVPTPSGSQKPLSTATKPPNVGTEKIPPIANVTQYSDSELFGLNRKNGNLIKYTGTSEVTIYSGKVKSYDIQGDTVVLLDQTSLNQMVVIDLKTNSQKKIDIPASPAVSIALSPDSKTAYYLGEFSITTKKPSINSISIDGTGHKKIGETTAQSLKTLKDDVILLFTENHAENKGILYFYDITQEKVLLSVEGNSYLVSPDKKNVSVKSTRKIDIINADTLSSRSQPTAESNRHIWKDDNTVVILQNGEQGVNYAILKLAPFQLSPFRLLVASSNIQTPIGFLKDKFLWQDYDELTESITFPEN